MPLTKLTPEQIAAGRARILAEESPKRAARRARTARAAAVPLPGPLREAFAASPQVLELPSASGAPFRFALLPVTAGHLAVLQQIGSPLMEVLSLSARSRMEPGENESELEARHRAEDARKRLEALAAERNPILDTADLLFVFSRPAAESRALLDKGDFRPAVDRLLDSLSPAADWGATAQALSVHYVRACATALSFRAPKTPGDTSFRSEPPRTTTGSAGS